MLQRCSCEPLEYTPKVRYVYVLETLAEVMKKPVFQLLYPLNHTPDKHEIALAEHCDRLYPECIFLQKLDFLHSSDIDWKRGHIYTYVKQLLKKRNKKEKSE